MTQKQHASIHSLAMKLEQERMIKRRVANTFHDQMHEVLDLFDPLQLYNAYASCDDQELGRLIRERYNATWAKKHNDDQSCEYEFSDSELHPDDGVPKMDTEEKLDRRDRARECNRGG